MAQVVSGKREIVFGPLRLIILTVTHTAVTTSTVTANDHGLRSIVGGWINNETTEDQGLLKINQNSGGAAIGSAYLTAVTSGDVVTMFLIGN